MSMHSFHQDVMRQMVKDHQGELLREAETRRMLRNLDQTPVDRRFNLNGVLGRLFRGLTRPSLAPPPTPRLTHDPGR
jgi:hypothetical protein